MLTSGGGGRSRRTDRRDPARWRALTVLGVLAVITVGLVVWAWGRGPAPQPAAGPVATPCPTGSAALAALAPRSVSVRVLNATNRTGLAGSVASQLKARGFGVSGVGNTGPITAPAEVRYGPAGQAAAALVARQVTGAKLVADGRSGAGVDLVLGNAFGQLAPAGQTATASGGARPAGC